MKHQTLLHALSIPLVTMVVPVYGVEYFTVEQAQKQLFPQAELFVDSLLTLTKDQRKSIKRSAGTRQRNDSQAVWRAWNDDKFLGWVFVDEVIGKHEYITYAVGVSTNGEVNGIEIMNYRETHGGEVQEVDWRDQFSGKTVADELKLGDDIANISGATLSCRNVTDGVKRLLVIWDLFLKNTV